MPFVLSHVPLGCLCMPFASERRRRNIVAIYRFMSTLGGPSDMTFGINQIEIADFISQAGLVDGKAPERDHFSVGSRHSMRRGLLVRYVV